MIRLLLAVFALALGLSVAACGGGGFAQPVSPYGGVGSGNWMAGGGG